MRRLELPTVTLCAAASVNIDATVAAIRCSTDQILFADVVLFSDSANIPLPRNGRVVPIAPIRSGRDYSRFVLRQLADHVQTDHCLIVQWDGFVIDARRWDDRFLGCDYIGAPWPQFRDGRDVGNGGFSLRSRKLIEACRDPRFVQGHPEDVAIGRDNREFLEREHGMIFADSALAEMFSFERSAPRQATFGFHGVFNMIPLFGADRFWQLYGTLSDRSTIFRDRALVMRQLAAGRNPVGRCARLLLDSLFARTPPQA